jgi:hypothetical protein
MDSDSLRHSTRTRHLSKRHRTPPCRDTYTSFPVQAYGRTTVQGSPFRVRCQPPRADVDNSSVQLLQEHAFIDDQVKALVRTVDQFGECCSAEGIITAQVLDAQTEKVLYDAHIVETGLVRSPTILPFSQRRFTMISRLAPQNYRCIPRGIPRNA